MATKTAGGLTGEDQATWRSWLLAARLLFEQLDHELDAAVGLSLPDYTLLVRLGEADELGMRMSELADSAVFSRSRISHAIDRLEKAGWVERRSCPTDRRGSFAALTEAGRSKLEQADPVHARVVRDHLLSPVSAEDRDSLRRAMDRIGESLGASPDTPTC